jgi:hypothetical protein
MTNKEIEKSIEMLRSDEHYYGEFGKKFLSNSNIKTLLEDPLNFGNETEDHVNLVKGSYFHHLTLEPEKIKDYVIVEASTRTTTLYKDAVKENDGKILLLQKEVEELEALTKTMMANSTAYNLIKDIDVEYEVPGVQKLEGEWWKLKADVVNRTQGLIVDLKTTGDIERFRYSADTYNYDSQAYMYGKYFNMDFVFVVMCKKTGRLGIFDCSPEFLARGKEKVEKAVEAYHKFTSADFNPKEYFISMTL